MTFWGNVMPTTKEGDIMLGYEEISFNSFNFDLAHFFSYLQTLDWFLIFFLVLNNLRRLYWKTYRCGDIPAPHSVQTGKRTLRACRSNPTWGCGKINLKPSMASQRRLLFSHSGPISKKPKFQLKRSVLPRYNIPFTHFSAFVPKVPSSFFYLFCHYSYSLEGRLWGTGRSNHSGLLGPKGHSCYTFWYWRQYG